MVVGSANIDLTTFTDTMPRAGETIFGREFHLGFGGKGANQAVAKKPVRRARLHGGAWATTLGPATIRTRSAASKPAT